MLSWLRLKAEVYIHTDFQGCWAVDTSGSRRVPFHLVHSGQSWLHLPDKKPRLLNAGDLVVFPHDQQHFLSSEPYCPTKALVEETISNTEHSDTTGSITGLTCGFFEFDNPASWPLLNSLPEAIVLELNNNDQLNNTRALLKLMISELEHDAPGTAISVSHLTHSLFIHILRSQIGSNPQQGILAALFDPRIGKALNQIHDQPQQEWTLEQMAQTAGMSRTGFSELFKELTGQTPVRYLAEWRMLQASELLRTTDLSVISIAEQCGYTSDVSFRKAFKSITGQAPGAVRRSGREG